MQVKTVGMNQIQPILWTSTASVTKSGVTPKPNTMPTDIPVARMPVAISTCDSGNHGWLI